jgi:hypothetical protein
MRSRRIPTPLHYRWHHKAFPPRLQVSAAGHAPMCFGWRSASSASPRTKAPQPRSGARMQPTAQAVGTKRWTSQPRRGERKGSQPETAIEAITSPRLFQDREEAITASRGLQRRQALVAGTSDKVQVMGTVSAMQSTGHDNPHGTVSIVPALAKSARAGHPEFWNGKERHEKDGAPGGPTAPR